MKRHTNMQEWFDNARIGNILNAYLLSGETVKDCFVWLDEPLQYAVITERRGYHYPILINDLNSLSVIIE